MDSKATKRELCSAANRQKGVLIINSLFRLGNHKHGHEYSEAVRLLADESLSRPYVLDGTFRTNVQVLQLLAIDTRKRKRTKSGVTPSDIGCDDDGYNHSPG
jgi:hypothetical protein